MCLVVMRSARSPLLREAGDLSSAITDHKGDLIAQGRDIPIHLGVDELHGEEVPRARARRAPAAGRRLVPQPAGGGRQSPARRQGDPAGLPRRPARSPLPSASPTGPTSAAPGPAATSPPPPRPGRRACASRRCACSPPTASTQEKLDFLLGQPARPGRARGRSSWPRSPRPGRPRRGWSALRGAWRGHDPRRARPAGRSLRSADARGDRAACPTASTRARISSTTTGRADSPPACGCASRSRATMPASTSASSDDAVAGPLNTTPFVAMAAVYYAIKAVAGPEIQPNGGCYRAVEVVHAAGLAVRARHRQAGGRRQPRDLAAAPSTPSCAPSSRRCRSG